MGTYIIKDTYERLQDIWRQREKKVNMERFDVQLDLDRNTWGLKKRDDGKGMFVFAEEALAYKWSFWSSFFVNMLMVVVCALLSAYLVYHKHDPQPVAHPRISAEEYDALAQEQRRLQVELNTAQKKIADLKAKGAQLEKMVKAQNVILQQREQQLKALAVSVPPQPVILKELQREASTPAGLQAAVTRNFGAIKIKVVE